MDAEELDRVMNPWLYTGKSKEPWMDSRPPGTFDLKPGLVPRRTSGELTPSFVKPEQLRTAADAAVEIRSELNKAVADVEQETRTAISALRDGFAGGGRLDGVFNEWVGYWNGLAERLNLTSTRLQETATAYVTSDQHNADAFGAR